MIDEHPVLKDVRQVTLEALAVADTRVYLYGSWARGTQTATSDIDVAVDPQRPLPAGVLARLRVRLEESHVPYRVEVVDLSTATEALREQVVRDGVLWSA